MAKNRIPISAELAAKVLFRSNRTCCVCNVRGKPVQIHHIDDDPANNDPNNLAVLCLECHDDTQVKGGFGRKLNKELVTTYRDNWLERVATQRIEADERAVTQVSGGNASLKKAKRLTYSEERSKAILAYVNSLPAYRKELRRLYNDEWASGVTARMVNASYAYTDALQGVLVTLAGFYAEGTFDGRDPHEFFSEIISSRYAWHRMHVEPYGPGTGGTIISVLVAGSVASDVENMIEDMATSLVGYDDEFDWRNWPQLWNEAGEPEPEITELIELIEKLGSGDDEKLLRRIREIVSYLGTKST